MAMRVKKEKKKVTIYTDKFCINGYIYVFEDSRLTDVMQSMSKKSDFLPVTEANVEVLSQGAIKAIKFVLVKIEDIEIICLAEE